MLRPWGCARKARVISPDTRTLERAVRGYVAAGSGLEPKQVVRGNGNPPASNGLYATVLLITATGQGIPYTLYQNAGPGQLDAATVGTVRARYSVQWYRQGARDAARRFSLWANSPAGLEHITAPGLTLLRLSAVRQVDDIIADAWEERTGLDLDLGYLETVRQEMAAIETIAVEVGGEPHIHQIEVRK